MPPDCLPPRHPHEPITRWAARSTERVILRGSYLALDRIVNVWSKVAPVPETIHRIHFRLDHYFNRKPSFMSAHAYAAQLKVAREIDPKCWENFDGESRDYQQAMEGRREASIKDAKDYLKEHPVEPPRHDI